MSDFESKIIIVTGGAGGIGKATCEAFIKSKAKVLCVDNNKDRIRKYKEENKSENLYFHELDITEEKNVKNFYDEVKSNFNGLDHLINNAGIATLNLCKDLSVEDWDLVMRVNLRGMFLMTKHAIPIFNDKGSILNISSQAARRAQRFTSHYNASKMGVIGFTRAVALELAPKIRVNAISPGTIGTEIIDNEINWRIDRGYEKTREEVEHDWLHRIPMGRYQMPQDIARAIVGFCSNTFSETTGETLNVSGGAVME
ncbi:SDR family oxidoreductase [Pelagibacteraceae bacterium]|nr:SDR family oxidoreductase [Pelagibacteraceae bacterium]